MRKARHNNWLILIKLDDADPPTTLMHLFIVPTLLRGNDKPINKGTAEHEQNGVTMPKVAAITLAMPSVRPASKARVRSGVKLLLLQRQV